MPISRSRASPALLSPALAIALIGSLVMARREGTQDLVLALALFAAGLLLKETAAVWPVVFVALYDGLAVASVARPPLSESQFVIAPPC